MVVSATAGGYVTNRPDPDFVAALAFLEANPVDFDAGSVGVLLFLNFARGLALLGNGESDRSVPHLIRAMRLADQGFPVAQGDVARAVAVALGEAVHPAVAIELAGYAEASFSEYPFTGWSHLWLQPRLDAIEATLDATEHTAARERGTRLDRRGFMRLLADAEARVAASAIDAEA
jgi:hypothetical protein